MPLHVGDIIELDIDRLSYEGGRGVGRHEGFVVFVGETAPQERIRARITSVKKNFSEAQLIEVLKASPHRRAPPCPVASRCGGCVWQHVSYPEQLEQKRGFISFALRKLLPPGWTVPPVVASPSEFRYRDRVQVHFENRGEHYGFFEKKSNRIVSIEDCHIADEAIFRDLSPILKKTVDRQHGKIELVLDREGRRRLRDLSKEDSEFRQVNPAQNRILRDCVLQEFADIRPGAENEFDTIWDLYCGDGNFTFSLREKFPTAKITGVEFSAAAIERAREHQARSLDHESARSLAFFASDVGMFLKRQKLDQRLAVLVDPARAGLDKLVIQELLRLKPARLVYVSCSLPSLARDLALLCAETFEIVNVTAFDMFPQTEYVETVVTLLPRDTRQA